MARIPRSALSEQLRETIAKVEDSATGVRKTEYEALETYHKAVEGLAAELADADLGDYLSPAAQKYYTSKGHLSAYHNYSKVRPCLRAIEEYWHLDRSDLIQHFDEAAVTSVSFMEKLTKAAILSSFEDSYPRLKLAAERRRNPQTKRPGVNGQATWRPADVEGVVHDLQEECLQTIERKWGTDRKDLRQVFGDDMVKNGTFMVRLKELAHIATYECVYPILEAAKNDRFEHDNSKCQTARSRRWMIADVAAAIVQSRSETHLLAEPNQGSLLRGKTPPEADVNQPQMSLPTPVRKTFCRLKSFAHHFPANEPRPTRRSCLFT